MASSTPEKAGSGTEHTAAAESTRGTRSVTPLTDIYETETALVLLVEMPDGRLMRYHEACVPASLREEG